MPQNLNHSAASLPIVKWPLIAKTNYFVLGSMPCADNNPKVLLPYTYRVDPPRPTELRIVGQYSLWLRFSDGASGEIDLEHLAGRGVFAAWLTPGLFDKAFISSFTRTVSWPGELDLDPDVLYAKATGKAVPGQTEAA